MMKIKSISLKIVAFLCACLALIATPVVSASDDLLIADFDGETYGQWKVEGDAFGAGPARGTLPRQMPVTGFQGERLVNSYHNGDNSTGSLTSPPLRIERPFINFLIGGGGYAGETCMNLLIDGKVVRTATGQNTRPGGSEALDWASWDVTEFQGKQAVIEIVDRRKGGWGHINVDHIVQSDRRIESTPAISTITAEKRYLHIPVKTGAAKRRLKILLDDAPVREMDIELAVGAEPSFLVAVDLVPWQGKTLTLDAGHFVGGDEALESLTQSDELPASDEIYREKLRPLFHFTSKIGWLNDPNGLVWHEGEWHLFYQHNPYGRNWGNMHWGHAVSPDLVHWKELGDAIFPWSDCQGAAFSGSAVIDHRNSSSFGAGGEPPLIVALTDTGAGESLAYSLDRGRTLAMYEGNPVVKHRGRDPKIIWHEPTRRWVMAVYDEFEDKRCIAFYSSPNLKQWQFHSRLEGYYECPDIVPLAVDGDTKNIRWVVYAADGKYAVGDFDGKVFTPEHDGKRRVWFGNFYAAQTYDNAPEGRRVQIGWGRGVTFPGMPFNQQMVAPVDLSLRSTADGVRLFATPVPELKTLRGERVQAKDLQLSAEPRRLDLDGEAFDIEAEFAVGASSKAGVRIRGVEILFDAAAQTLACGDKQAPLHPVDGAISLRILADWGSLEVFANEGRVAISHGTILDPQKPAIELVGQEAIAVKVAAWKMRSIWE